MKMYGVTMDDDWREIKEGKRRVKERIREGRGWYREGEGIK